MRSAFHLRRGCGRPPPEVGREGILLLLHGRVLCLIHPMHILSIVVFHSTDVVQPICSFFSAWRSPPRAPSSGSVDR